MGKIARVKEYRPFEMKAIGEAGEFEGWLSTFGNIDSYGDTVVKGAYKKTVAENNGKFPILWVHDHSEPLGSLFAEEREKGLWVKGSLNLDVQRAREARSLVQRGDVSGMSIYYTAIQVGFKEMDGQQVRVLKEIRLYEGSILPIPADNEARIQSMKSAAMLGDPNAMSLDEWRERLIGLPADQLEEIKSLLEAEKSGRVPTLTPPVESAQDEAVVYAFEEMRKSLSAINDVLKGEIK